MAGLSLQPGEVAAANEVGQKGTSRTKRAVAGATDLTSLLQPFEGSPIPSSLPRASGFANVKASDLLSFGQRLQAVREQQLTELQGSGADPQTIAKAQSQLNAVLVANNSFDASGAVSPVGMLNLERLEMTPAGMQRGELIATIPLAPGETTTVFSNEWSVTTQEFSSIVTDSYENYSATGVTENTELAQSTTSQMTHNNQFNVNATASGKFPLITSVQASSSFSAQDQHSQSATASRKDAVTTTKQASSRVKQAHKTTISNTTVTGSQEGTTRTITNPSTNPIRIDYFSLIRKWRVRLYRYGLRLTYDITIPEPAAALRESYAQLTALQSQAEGVFQFTVNGKPVTHADITADTLPGEGEPHYLFLADQLGTDVPVAPDNPGPPIYANQTDYTKPITFTVPDNYWITNLKISFTAQSNDAGFFATIPFTSFSTPPGNNPNVVGEVVTDEVTGKPFLYHQTGDQSVTVSFHYPAGIQAPGFVNMTIEATTEPIDTFFAQWQGQVWSALYNAAQTNYYAEQQAINAQVSALQDAINGVDTLTLRREENDEIMKGLLRWLIGQWFDFMPQNVVNVVQQAAAAEQVPVPNNPPGDSQTLSYPLYYGEAFADAYLPLSKAALTTMYQYGEEVKFINEAIEWENIVYFLYSYFWDVPQSWDFIRKIQHPDSTRQAFLRAGSARVVVPIRQGFEQAWTQFVETGDPTTALAADNPYMTIAQEIYNYDQTNYPGIPPANPAGGTSDDESGAVAAGCAEAVAKSEVPVTLTVDTTVGFLVGYTVVIDQWTAENNVQESQTIKAIPDSSHLTISALQYAHDGSTTEFPIVQPGEAGLLIGEWSEYTPTSGTDIAIGSDLTTLP